MTETNPLPAASEVVGAHTPGPWTLEPATVSYDGRPSSFINPSLKSVSATRWPGLARVVTRMEGEEEDEPEGIAHARLISAAPDLLEALKELHLKAVVGTDEERHAALNKAWAAILKAETSILEGGR